MIVNPGASHRVVVTKELPGARWLQLLTAADCRVEVSQSTEILSEAELRAAFGDHCDAAIGQLTESWSAETLGALRAAGATIYSQYAVGYDNVDVAAATRLGLPVGNTPGVLTETTAQLAVALTFAAARRIAEGDRVMRAGAYHGWLPSMLLGALIYRATLGIVGAGREDEPAMAPGLAERDNVVLAQPLGSATTWTREGMAALAAASSGAPMRC